MNTQELPRYQCHKQVRAVKIAAIEFNSDGSAKFAAMDGRTYSTGGGYRSRFKGTDADLGYFVVYDDGYQSWSPAKAFEDGYTRIMP